MAIFIALVIGFITFKIASIDASNKSYIIQLLEQKIKSNEEKIKIIKQYIVMDEKLENILIADIREMKTDISNIKIELAKMKVQAAFFSGLVFAGLTIAKEVFVLYVMK